MSFIDKIKEIPIVDHAERMGFTLTRSGKYFSLREHESVMIDIQKNCFWRNSTFSSGYKGGAGSIIDFVMEFDGYQTAKEAIDSLGSEYGIERDNYKKVVIPKRERVIVESKPKRAPGDLALPERGDNLDAVYNYLLNTRKISKNVVDYFVENDMLYQDKRRNAVFKTDKFACLRSTGKKKFVLDVDGCDYNECFFFKGKDDSKELIVAESVIDIMSIMSVYERYGTDFRNFAYLALSGTNKLVSVFYHLENEPGIKTVRIGMDNDSAGREAADKIIQGIQEKQFEVASNTAYPPSGKDWNEYLVSVSDRVINMEPKSEKNINHEQTTNVDVENTGDITTKNVMAKENAVEYKYYAIQRPVNIGTYPKDGMIRFENFDDKRFIPEIDHEAWGVLIYDRMLAPKELEEFELVGIPFKNMKLEQRLSGDQLEKAKLLTDNFREIGVDVDEEKGIVTLYHSTDPKMAHTILNSNRMKSETFGDVRGVLLSTYPELAKESDVILKLSVPVEYLKMHEYDFDSDEATFYLLSDERVFDVKDYNVEMVDIPHREEQIKNDLKTAKEDSTDGGFERFLENLEYTDVEDLILMFDFAKRMDESLFPIDFSDENGNIIETEEQNERVIDFVYEKSNQRILFDWLEKQGANFDDLVNVIHGETSSFESVEQSQGNKPRETISLAGADKDTVKEHLMNGIQNVMNSEDYKNWLNTGSRLFYNNYSFNNAMLIWMQKDNATHVMGYEAWKEFGRSVEKGASGAKILMPVMAYEKVQGGLYKKIVSELTNQLEKDPELKTADYRLFSSKIEFTMNRSKMIGLRVNGNEKGIFQNEEQLKKFISQAILGKVPMYYTTGTVFDAKDTYIPEFLWVSKGYTKDELVLDDKGKPIKNKRGEYKIYNTPERQARFKPALDTSVVAKDPEKMKELMDVLKTVSEKNGIPVYMRGKDEDKTLKDGAAGYFSRQFDNEHPKGFIVIDKDLEITEMCTVMIHEMGHSDMHGSLEKINELSNEMGEEATREIREIQAESVAYMTASIFGIETSTKSFQYLAAYAQGFDVQGLQKSMDAIYKECKKLTSEISDELEARGLNLDLSKKDPEMMITSEQVENIKRDYIGYVIEREEALEDIQNELPGLVVEYKNDADMISVLKEQKNNIISQLDDIDIIKNEVDSLDKVENRSEQDKCINDMEKAKERIEVKVRDFEKLTENFIEVKNSRQGTLKEEFEKSPTKVLKSLSEEYPKLNDLSTAQKHYIATSKFINKHYKELLDTNPELFVNAVVKRAETILDIASKNGTFVEVNFCEQWTEQPIFEQGVLCHPKVANTIIKNAELQLRHIRQEAQNNGEYFPYSKCDLTIYTSHRGGRDAFNTRIDIGDGEQKDLISHIEGFCITNRRRNLIDNMKTAVNEQKAKDKIATVEISKDPLTINDSEGKIEHEVNSMKEWKEKVNERREASAQNKLNDDQQLSNSKSAVSHEK